MTPCGKPLPPCRPRPCIRCHSLASDAMALHPMADGRDIHIHILSRERDAETAAVGRSIAAGADSCRPESGAACSGCGRTWGLCDVRRAPIPCGILMTLALIQKAGRARCNPFPEPGGSGGDRPTIEDRHGTLTASHGGHGPVPLCPSLVMPVQGRRQRRRPGILPPVTCDAPWRDPSPSAAHACPPPASACLHAMARSMHILCSSSLPPPPSPIPPLSSRLSPPSTIPTPGFHLHPEHPIPRISASP
jgi:hypothetical protein